MVILLNVVLFAFWFFLPVGVANMAPVLVAKLPLLKQFTYPLDFYKTYRGKRVFGDHKTVRGLIAGIILSIATISLQQYLYYLDISLLHLFAFDYLEVVNPFIFGTLAALGALLGDAIESFFKRQINVAPGRSWFPFDQIDFIIGGIVFLYPYFPLSSYIFYLVILTVWFGMHILVSWTGYMLGVKDAPI